MNEDTRDEMAAFHDLVTPEPTGWIVGVLDRLSPIEDRRRELAFEFRNPTFRPNEAADECREQGLTYSRSFMVECCYVNRGTGEIRPQEIFMCDLPWITEAGTFIRRGVEVSLASPDDYSEALLFGIDTVSDLLLDAVREGMFGVCASVARAFTYPEQPGIPPSDMVDSIPLFAAIRTAFSSPLLQPV